MTTAENGRLKLRARDAEDYRVLSAVLQDALVPVSDMTQLPRDKRFVMVANRFRWEARAPLGDLPDAARAEPPAREGDARFEDAPLYERVHCGITFDRVKDVHYRGFRKSNPDRILNLLAVVPDQGGVTLQFSEDAALRLQGPRVVCHLEDLGEPWPTHWRPSHDPAEAESSGETTSGSSET
jgi:hypothetical protein